MGKRYKETFYERGYEMENKHIRRYSETPVMREMQIRTCLSIHGVAKSWARRSNFTFTFHFHALEKAMATHSSVLAWRVPGTGEPGGLPSVGSHRVGHDWSDSAAAAASITKVLLEQLK